MDGLDDARVGANESLELSCVIGGAKPNVNERVQPLVDAPGIDVRVEAGDDTPGEQAADAVTRRVRTEIHALPEFAKTQSGVLPQKFDNRRVRIVQSCRHEIDYYALTWGERLM